MALAEGCRGAPARTYGRARSMGVMIRPKYTGGAMAVENKFISTRRRRRVVSRRDPHAALIETRHRFERVMQFIDSHVDDAVSVNQLADVAELSQFYFIRLYHAHIGESPGRTMQRLRLRRARARLARGHSVQDVSVAAGYSSPQSFSVAFQNWFREYPSNVRQISSVPCLPPHVEWLDDVVVAGLPSRGARDVFSRTVDRGFATLELRHKGLHPRDVVALIHDAPFFRRPWDTISSRRYDADRVADPPLTIDVAVPSRPLPASRRTDHVRLPGGPHLVVRAHGDWAEAAGDVVAAMRAALRKWPISIAGGPVRWRPLRDPWLTLPSEMAREFHIPLRRIG